MILQANAKRAPGLAILGLGAGLGAVLPGPDARAQCVEGCEVILELSGEAAGDQFGWVSNNVGDIDGGGVNDLILTAPTNDGGGGSAGRAYVYSGETGLELFRVTGSPGWTLGHDGGAAGDVNGDGTRDVIVGAPAVGTGRAIVYSGVDGSVIHTFPGEVSGDRFGSRVSGDGDFNGDGTPDLLIGAPLNDVAGASSGRAYVYSGADFSELCAINGPTSGDQFGSGVAFIGDVSQPPDGRDDICVGAQNGGNGSGIARVYEWTPFGCEFLYQLTPPAPASNFGQWFMNGGHDVNGDGTPDIYVNDFGVNRAHLFSGVDGALLYSLTGDNNGGFGIGRLERDLTGDGLGDLVLAAWSSDIGAPNAGKAFIYSGQTQMLLETLTHDVAGATFGFDANGMGDVNLDGRDDYLITAAWDSGQRGRAYVIAGTVTPTDLDGDGATGVADLVLLILNWGPCPGEGMPCIGDTDRNGVIDVNDLVTLLLSWG